LSAVNERLHLARSQPIASIKSKWFGGTGRASSLQQSYAASTTDDAHPIRAAIGAAITLWACPTLIPYSHDSDNVEREIETIEARFPVATRDRRVRQCGRLFVVL